MSVVPGRNKGKTTVRRILTRCGFSGRRTVTFKSKRGSVSVLLSIKGKVTVKGTSRGIGRVTASVYRDIASSKVCCCLGDRGVVGR